LTVNWRIWTRKLHRWGAILCALPFLLVIVTGILLQVKKEWAWIQPPTQRGQGATPAVSMDTLLAATRSRPETEVQGWDDIERIDIQPNRGIAKVQARNRWEVQVDLQTGEVLHVAFRRSDLIETLHDGSWFHDRARLFLFLPSAVVVLGLWLTGIYLFFLPGWVRRRKRKLRVSRFTCCREDHDQP
jgi:uncharacterized iron-regulated membrane protein